MGFNEFSNNWKQYQLKDIAEVFDGSHGSHKAVKNNKYLLGARNIINGEILIERKQEEFINYKKYLLQNIFNENLKITDKWKKVKICDIFTERKDKNKEGLDLLSVTLNQGVIKRSEIDDKNNSSTDKSNYKYVKPGDIVYNSMRMWQGASGVSRYEGIVSPAYTILIPKENISPTFFQYYFKTEKMLNEFRKYSQGLTSDTWNLKYPLISQIKLKIPNIKDQKRIEKYLILIDKKIDLSKEKIESIKKYKQGLLQKMFI